MGHDSVCGNGGSTADVRGGGPAPAAGARCRASSHGVGRVSRGRPAPRLVSRQRAAIRPHRAPAPRLSLRAPVQRYDRAPPPRRVPAVQEGGQGAASLFLAVDLPGEDVAVGVRVDGGEGPAPEFGRLQRLRLLLHRAAGVEAVAAGEGRPPRIAALALGRGQFVGAHLLVGQQHPLGVAPTARAPPSPARCPRRSSRSRLCFSWASRVCGWSFRSSGAVRSGVLWWMRQVWCTELVTPIVV